MSPDLEPADVPAVIRRELADVLAGSGGQAMSGDSAVAAALAAEDLEVGAYPLGFLARYIRTAGLAKALDLPEPLIRPDQAELARTWMRAAATAPEGLRRDEVFAQWLDLVATLLAVRRNARLPGNRPAGDGAGVNPFG